MITFVQIQITLQVTKLISLLPMLAECSFHNVKNPVAESTTVCGVVCFLAVQQVSILWNLINLGYADALYSAQEKEIVDFLRAYWKVPESIYQEMIDVAETCSTLEKHRQWVDSLPDNGFKQNLLDQIKKDMKFVQKTIETTISEIVM